MCIYYIKVLNTLKLVLRKRLNARYFWIKGRVSMEMECLSDGAGHPRRDIFRQTLDMLVVYGICPRKMPGKAVTGVLYAYDGIKL